MTSRLTPCQRNWGTRIHDLVFQDMRLIVLENEVLRVGVLAGKGTDIIELNYKPQDLDFVWLSPQGVRNPVQSGAIPRDLVATFVETYPGGWQEVFPNGGAPSAWAGAQYGQHDEVFAVPWEVEIVDDAETSIAVRFTARTQKVPTVISKTLRMVAGEPRLRIEEQLTNTADVPVRAMWGHHVTFGPPFLVPGCRIRLPEAVKVTPNKEPIAPGGRRVTDTVPFAWPYGQGATGPVDLSIVPQRGTPSDIMYLSDFPEDHAWYEVTDPSGRFGSRLEWDARVMPYLWYWQEFGAATGYPWYGKNYNIGLEPFSSYPTNGLAEAVENGTALELEPGNTVGFWLTWSVIEDREGGAR
jgi:hypothetical protein